MTVRGCVAALAALASLSSTAAADRYEATVSVRPVGGVARVDDVGAPEPATVAAAGLTGGLAWGLRNWLDVGAEVLALGMPAARYDGATLPVSNNPQMGTLERTTRLAQLRLGATLRLGVAWVPTLHLGVGAGARQRSAARLTVDAGGGTTLQPDDEPGGLAFDVVAVARAGLDHRVNRRWTLGVAGGITQCVGLGAPNLQILEATVNVAYSWYPLW